MTFPELLLYFHMKIQKKNKIKYIRSHVSTGNEIQCDPFCLPSEFLAHELKKSCSSLQSSLSSHCSQQSISFLGETLARQLECFPGKKPREPQFLTFWINVVVKRLLSKEYSIAPCSAALVVSPGAESPKTVKAK